MGKQSSLHWLICASVLAMASAAYQVCSVRMISYVFPMQMLFAISFIASISIFFSGIGAFFSKKCLGKPAITSFIAGILVLLSMYAVNSIHIWYPGFVLPFLVSAFFIAFPLLLYGVLIGVVYTKTMEIGKESMKLMIVLSSLFFFAGYAASEYLIRLTGIWNIIIVTAIITSSIILKPKHLAVIIVFCGLLTVFINFDKYIFNDLMKKPWLWVKTSEKQEYITGKWSPYSRLDFIKLEDGRLAGLYNGIQQWSVGETKNDIEIRRKAYEKISGNVLVIGTGGGHGLLSLKNANKITAVELDPDIIELSKTKLLSYNNGIYNSVNAVSGDGRAFIEKSSDKYNAIIYEAADLTFFHSGSSLVDMKNYLYTAEGASKAALRLDSEGYFMIIITAGLLPSAKFIKNLPEGFKWKIWHGDKIDTISTVVVGYDFIIGTYSDAVLENWGKYITGLNLPLEDKTEDVRKMLSGLDPVTDDQPLFNSSSVNDYLPYYIWALILSIIAFLFIILSKRRSMPLYFTLIGIAFILAELYMINIFRAFMGGYTETAAMVLGVLSISMAAGTLCYEKIRGNTIAILVVSSMILLFLMTEYLPLGAGMFLKLLWTALAIAPAGFTMGIFFPKGMAQLDAAEAGKFYALDTIGTALGFVLFYIFLFASGMSLSLLFAIPVYLTALFIIKSV